MYSNEIRKQAIDLHARCTPVTEICSRLQIGRSTLYLRKGLSGGVTLLGSIFELAGASVIALTFFLFSLQQSQTDPPRALIDAAIIASCGFAGAMFDSLLGSLLQVKFRCPQCGAITEREMHCGKEFELHHPQHDIRYNRFIEHTWPSTRKVLFWL